MLEGIAIGNYRGFMDFEIQGLAPVTIVTGDNGTGKTNLLRACAYEISDGEVRHTYSPIVRADSGVTHEQDDRPIAHRVGPIVLRNARFIGAFDRLPDPEGDLKRYLAARLARRSEALVEGLQTILPNMIDIEFLPYDNKNQFVVRDGSRYWSLQEMGAGAGVLFKLLVAIDAMQPGEVVAIDEIEIGLYHRRMPEVFKAIIHAAKRADVQLIVSTHSDEALEALVEAAEETPDRDVVVVRMYRDEHDAIRGLVLEEQIVRNAVRGAIELR